MSVNLQFDQLTNKIGPFFNHNPAFGFESESEDIYLEDDEEMEVPRVKGGVQANDGFGKELKGM